MWSEYPKDYKQNSACEMFSSPEQSFKFKDWQSLKDKQNRLVENVQFDGREKLARNKLPTSNSSSCTRNNHVTENYFQFDERKNVSGFLDTRNFSEKACNDFGTWRNGLGSSNNSFCNFNNCGRNSFTNLNRFHNFEKPNNLSSYPAIKNNLGEECNGTRRFNQSSNLNTSSSSFPSNLNYFQKDMTQKPLLNKSFYNNDNKKPVQTEKSVDIRKFSNEAKVYVRNPKAQIDGKPYVPKPKIPEENFEISRAEKKEQWKKYREAMKPFKNREFYNAKRVVQRLSKKAPTELTDNEIIRLTKSREIMAVHKARLSAKHANHIRSDDDNNKLGDVVVIKKEPLTDSTFDNPSLYQA